MSGPASKGKKKKRTDEIKRLKMPNGSLAGKSMLFENTLSLPIQQALFKFREASEQELMRLRKEGLDPSAAINKLVEKMRTIESDVSPCFSRQELDLVMEMAGINEEGAMRALILRSELAKLRHDGFNHPEAINELAKRMKRLAGSKRRISLADGTTIIDTKHRRKDSTSAPSSSSSSTLLTTTTTSSSLSPRVSFSPLDAAADGLGRTLEAPTNNLRKRLQDVLMMDAEGWGQLRKRPRFFDKDASDSDESSADDHPDLYRNVDELGEFSQDEEKDNVDDGLDEVGDDLLLSGATNLDDIPLFTTFTSDYPSSDDEKNDDEGGSSLSPSPSTLTHPLLDDYLPNDTDDTDDSWTTLTATAAELLALPPTTPTFLAPPPPSISSPPPRVRGSRKTRDSSPSPTSLSQRTTT